MDEDDVEIVPLEGTLRDVWKLPLFYVSVTMLDITEIPYGIGDIYTLKVERGVTTPVRMYQNLDKLPDVDTYACEDSKSGLQYHTEYLDSVVTMGGRHNWKKHLDKECLIMDSAALSETIRDILDTGVKLFAPQSFEYLLLKYFTNLTTKDLVELLEPTDLRGIIC